MKNRSTIVNYEDVLAALGHLGTKHHNEAAVVRRWVNQAEKYMKELEDVNHMYKVVSDTQKKLLDQRHGV
jgi:hypothetical protein